MPEIRKTALGQSLVTRPRGRSLIDTSGAAYKNLFERPYHGYHARKAWRKRMQIAEERMGIKYRPIKGKLPWLINYPNYDFTLQVDFPNGVTTPIRLTIERGYEDIDGMAHLHIYQQFAKFTKIFRFINSTEQVLDCACGSGYGSAYLAEELNCKVIGVDIDQEVVQYAQQRYANNNRHVSFHQSSAAQLSFLPDRAVKAIISIETIEHVDDSAATITEFARVLDDAGVLCITSPDATDRPGSLVSPFHVVEYTITDFEQLLKSHFSEVEITRTGGYLLALCCKTPFK